MNEQVKKLLENLAKSFEKPTEKIFALFEFAKNKLAAETNKKDPGLSIAAVHSVRATLSMRKEQAGKEINVIFLGKDGSKDQTEKLRKEILEEFWDNPQSRKKVIREGKIMVKKIANGDPKIDFDKMYSPVVSIEKMVEVDGEKIVVKGELWDPAAGKDPKLRDFRTHRDDEGNLENWNYSEELIEDWKTTLFGIGYFEDTPDVFKKIQIRFYGDLGNPTNPEFVVKNLRFQEPYKLKVQLNENLSNENCYVCNAKTKPIFSGEAGEELDFLAFLESLNENWRTMEQAKGNEPKDLIEIVDLADLVDWHKRRRAQRDDDGDIVKNDSGWDATIWDEYVIIPTCTYLGKREFKETYQPAVIQHDSTGKQSTYMNYDTHLPMDIPIPCDIHLVVKTSRGTTRYDRESREKFEDPENADLRIDICGYKVVVGFEKIEFPKELIGDL